MRWTIFEILYLAGFFVGSVIRRGYTRGGRRIRAAVSYQGLLDTALIVLAALGFVAIPVVYLTTGWLDFANYNLPVWAGWLGVPVFTAAIILLWKAHSELGVNFSPTLRISERHWLVTTGVYRYIRHPMYAAHWLWAIAQTLLLSNWLAGPAFLVCLAPLYFLRIRSEERMMAEQFGDEYLAYIKRTGRIIPRFLHPESEGVGQ